MHVQVSTDHNIEGTADFGAYVTRVVEHALSHLGDRVTRVEVHVSDQNGEKHGPDDLHCKMEVRLEGRQPTGVSHRASTVELAVGGAADKLKRSIESTLGRLGEHR